MREGEGVERGGEEASGGGAFVVEDEDAPRKDARFADPAGEHHAEGARGEIPGV